MSSYLDFIYIPLCIYFNIDLLNNIWDMYTFTFHYVSISTCHYGRKEGRNAIYIPLCIYFNYFLTV